MSWSAVLILASGSSSRFGDETSDKLLQELGNSTVIDTVVNKFLNSGFFSMVCVITKPENFELYRSIITKIDSIYLVGGGKTRQESVKKGLEFLLSYKPKNVLIHDAARPFVSTELIKNVIEKLDRFDAVDILYQATDTLKTFDGDNLKIIPRAGIYQTQTPQGFTFDLINMLHQLYKDNEVTDDISLCIKAGVKVGYTQGEASNYKITFKEDLSCSIE